jgi:hypothetical protein
MNSACAFLAALDAPDNPRRLRFVLEKQALPVKPALDRAVDLCEPPLS